MSTDGTAGNIGLPQVPGGFGQPQAGARRGALPDPPSVSAPVQPVGQHQPTPPPQQFTPPPAWVAPSQVSPVGYMQAPTPVPQSPSVPVSSAQTPQPPVAPPYAPLPHFPVAPAQPAFSPEPHFPVTLAQPATPQPQPMTTPTQPSGIDLGFVATPAPQHVPTPPPVYVPSPPPVLFGAATPVQPAPAVPSIPSAPASQLSVEPSVTAALPPVEDVEEEPDEDALPPRNNDNKHLADDDDKPAKPVKHRRKSDILLLVLAFLLMIGGAVFGVMAWQKSQANKDLPVDMDNNRIMPEDTSALDPDFLKAANTVDDIGVRFVINSVGLDVPLGEVNAVNGVLNPPGFVSAYRVRNLGVTLDAAATGTVYVVAHALRPPGRGPGNFVTDLSNGTVTVKVGDLIQVGDVNYRMTDSRVVSKADLGGEADLWANTPGMLVFVTCMETTIDKSGHAVNNAVIIGQMLTG